MIHTQREAPGADPGLGKYKVLVVGVDGATFDVIKPWARSGRLPHFARLMEEGSWSTLLSTIHPLTPPAWSSFMTGKNPGNHGIFDFQRVDQDGSFSLVNGAYLRARTLWSILSEAGDEIGVINVPMTYPPQSVNGFLISGMDTPWGSSEFTYPPELTSVIRQRFGEYRIETPNRSRVSLPVSEFTHQYVENLSRMVEVRGDVACYLLEKHQPDFFMVTFVATDRVHHALGKYLDDAALIDSPPAGSGVHQILSVYETVDRQIGRLLERVDEDWVVVVVSDHGAAPYEKVFGLNYWLVSRGFLHLAPRSPSPLWQPYANRLRRKTSTLARKLLRHRRPRRRRSAFLGSVIWAKTRAYSFGAFGSIYVNLRGREPHGIIEPGAEYEDLCERLTQKLLDERDPETGKRIVAAVHRSRDIYRGKYLHEAPDLLLETEQPYFIRNSLDVFEHETFQLLHPAGRYGHRDLEDTGKHDPRGVLIARGPVVQRGAKKRTPHIIDLAPTVLYLRGVPIPRDMDGQVLLDWISPNHQASHHVRYSEIGDEEELPPGGGRYSDEEREEVLDHLQGLGYLD